MKFTRFGLAEKVVKDAGEVLRCAKTNILKFVEKTGWQDIVTKYDKQVEQMIRSAIRENFPNDTIVGEEYPSADGTEYTWYIDPIDGTTNFVNQHHDYCISVACYAEEQADFGIVLDVERDHFYTARAGKGAFRNGNRLSCVHRKSVHEMLLTTPIVQQLLLDDGPYTNGFRHLSQSVRGVRSKGSAALELCLLAAGEADLFATPIAGPWDHAAAALILKEAGGASCDYEGGPLPLQGKTTILGASGTDELERFRKYLEEWS